MAQGEQREEQQAKQQAGAAAVEEEGMPELTLKQALVGHNLPVTYATWPRFCGREHMALKSHLQSQGCLLAECSAHTFIFNRLMMWDSAAPAG